METTFTINWAEVLKAIGYITLGICIVLGVIAYLFRNFRIYQYENTKRESEQTCNEVH